VGGPKSCRNCLKTIYLKYFYKIETLVSFEVLPLRLDAEIPALLPMLGTLSKIFNGNAVKGHGDSRWTSAMSANCLPFKSCFIRGNKKSCKEHGTGGGGEPHFVFSQKGGILLTLQRFYKNRWWPRQHFCWSC
jgi:hypothetical protein